MFYYIINTTFSDTKAADSKQADDGFTGFQNHKRIEDRIQRAFDELVDFQNIDEQLAVTKLDEQRCDLVMVTTHQADVRERCEALFSRAELKLESLRLEETTMFAVDAKLRAGDIYWLTAERFWRSVRLDQLALWVKSFSSGTLEEQMVTPLKSHAVDELVDELCLPTLADEINRIRHTVVSTGHHPVNYLIEATDLTALQTMVTPLISTALAHGWIRSARVATVQRVDLRYLNMIAWRQLFRASVGSTVVIELTQTLHQPTPTLREFAELLQEYGPKVLILIKIPTGSTATRKTIESALPEQLFINLNRPALTQKEVLDYVDAQLELQKLKRDADLDEQLEALTYPVKDQELQPILLKWQGMQLRRREFPVYAKFELARQAREAKASKQEGDSLQQLQALIGLDDVKKLTTEIINNIKIQHLRKQRHLTTTAPNMHMVFTGNPGTAKTTVARLIAKILRDNHILRVGDLVEVGRADVIGQYVGQTAPKIKALFAQAAGSVLFFDEAYNLADKYDAGYGAEAISTILAEMENHRDDVVVIFAGYPKETNEFLDTNPGLRSRIPFHLEFPDYQTTDLLRIADLMLKAKNLMVTPAARIKLGKLIDAIRRDDSTNFGNGRTVRNLIEHAVLKQSTRLSAFDQALTDQQLQTLTAADFTIPETTVNTPVRIGF